MIPSYRSLYEQGHPAPQVASISQSNSTSSATICSSGLAVQFVSFLNFQELIGDRLLNRLLGLSNLYYIDPDDKEIREELQLREQLVRILLDADESSLKVILVLTLGIDLGSVRSGIQSILLALQWTS